MTGTGKPMAEQQLKIAGNAIVSHLGGAQFDDKQIQEIYASAVDPGHKLRGSLVIFSHSLFAKETSKILPAAGAIELLHKSSLVHDDIVDKDEYRRGLPTFYTKYGVEWGILNGDLIAALAFQELSKLKNDFDSEKVLASYKTLSHAFRKLYDGQMRDLLYESRFDVSEADYLEMIGAKTSYMLQAALELGAILGGASESQTNSLKDFGKYFGLAFQIQNDVNNLMGLEEKLGRRAASDIFEKKRTIMILKALSDGSEEEKNMIQSAFSKHEVTETEVDTILNIMMKLGSIDYAIKKASTFAEKGKDALNDFPESEGKSVLLGLLDYIKGEMYWKKHIKKSEKRINSVSN